MPGASQQNAAGSIVSTEENQHKKCKAVGRGGDDMSASALFHFHATDYLTLLGAAALVSVESGDVFDAKGSRLNRVSNAADGGTIDVECQCFCKGLPEFRKLLLKVTISSTIRSLQGLLQGSV